MMLDPTLVAGIEYDLRHYRRWQARLAELAAELADVSERRGDVVILGVRVQQGHSDPTCATAQARERLWRERRRLQRRVRRIDHFLKAVSSHHRRLVELWYFDGRPSHVVARRLHVARSTAYRMRQEALATYAQVAGLVPQRNAG
ncbi:MAG: hypothetical protein RDU89_06940 [bacterium]|nr:hypothetical protein [bacterium]